MGFLRELSKTSVCLGQNCNKRQSFVFAQNLSNCSSECNDWNVNFNIDFHIENKFSKSRTWNYLRSSYRLYIHLLFFDNDDI